jgi:DNA-binding response OmpR family regulator
MSDEMGQRHGPKRYPQFSLRGQRDSEPGDAAALRVRPFHLDPNERKLLRGSEIVELTPKAFDTLLLLVRNSGHLLEKARDVRRRGQPIQQHLSPAKGLG